MGFLYKTCKNIKKPFLTTYKVVQCNPVQDLLLYLQNHLSLHEYLTPIKTKTCQIKQLKIKNE